MKRLFTIILTLVIALSALTSLTGCMTRSEVKAKKNEKAAVCFVLANTANSQGLNLQSPLVQDTVYSTILNYGYINIINADGMPELVMSKSFDIEERFKSASKKRLEMDARSKATNLISAMHTVIADDPEIDFYESLDLARKSLTSLTGYDSKFIIVLGTGISTTGTLDFNNNLISAEPDAIVERLKEEDELLDFTGINIYWQHLCETSEPQKPLSRAQKNRLQDIYASVVEAGGGTFHLNEFIGYAASDSTDYPYVTPVEFPESTPIKFDTENLKDDTAFTEPMVLGESEVQFVGDKADYLYPEKALESIRPVAEYLLEHETVKLLLVGTTAGDETTDYSLRLSKDRAEAVKKTLVELNVSADRIITVGLGSSDSWHVENLGTGDAASVNRKVVLLDTRSKDAVKIMNGYQS